MQLKIIKPEHRKNHGRMIGKELHLKQGICYTNKPLLDQQTKSETFIKIKENGV